MMGKLLPIVSIFCAFLANAQEPNNNDYVWQDIQTFKINKEEPRAFFTVYSDFEKASKKISIDDVKYIYSGDCYKLLNGDWKFFFAKNPSEIKDNFFAKNFDDSKWAKIDVPNSWQCRGYDRIFYNNIPAEFQFDMQGRLLAGYGDCSKDNPNPVILNPTIPEIHRQVGIYRREFSLENDWKNKEIFVRFNGVRTGFKVFVNGKFAGYAEDSFTPSEFNITKFLQAGKNSLAVEVFKYTTGGFFEMQDMPHMVGIIRDVMLIARPQVYVRDYHALVKLSDDLKKADINLDIDVKNMSKSDIKDFYLDGYIIDKDGKPVSEKSLFSKKIDSVKSLKNTVIRAQANVENFKLWSPDKPELYALLIKLADAEGNELETIRADFAFRKFELRSKSIFLNNTPLLIKGTNHHDWSPDKGKAYSYDWMLKDMRLMKQANVNFVRTSHYPKDDIFYMLCSRFGILVLDECNQEQHGYRNCAPLDFDNFIPASVDRMRNMVLRDRNVPCVVIFSLGNESAGRVVKGHGVMAQVSRELSPDRFVHSEAEVGNIVNQKVEGFSDFVSPMYGGVDRMRWYLNLKNETKPFFFCEYAHAMGNAIGNLQGKWDMIRQNPSLNGGFIWDWVDQGLYLKREDDASKTYLSDCRDWNTWPSAGNFCLNGVIFADRTYAAKYYEVQRVYQDIQISLLPDSKIKLSNEFISTNLNEFAAFAELSLDGVKVAETRLPDIDLPAGKSTEIEMQVPKFDTSKSGQYYYSIVFKRKSASDFAKACAEAARAQFFLKDVPTNKMEIAGSAVSISDKPESLKITAANAEYVFDKKTATLVSLALAKTPLITTPLEFDISSAFIDNERNRACGQANREYGLDKLASKNVSLKFEKLASNAVRVVCKKYLVNEEGDGFALESVYTILGTGLAEVAYSAQKINDTPKELNLPRVGVRMGISNKLKEIEFFGKGPFANYNDRQSAADVGRYKSDISEWFENYTYPQDTGNRQDVRWLFASAKSGAGLLVVSETRPLAMAVLEYSQEALKAAKHPHNLASPENFELRVAQSVRGLGNSSCGPDTRREFRNYFSGKVDWNFLLIPVRKSSDLKNALLQKVPEKFAYTHTQDSKNLIDESLQKKPAGKCVSENAKFEQSSLDKQYNPRDNRLLSDGAGTFSFHTMREKNPYIIIELEKPFLITGAEILNRADAQGDRTHPLYMYISDDGKTWKKVWSSDMAKSRWIVELKNPQSAKFVKLSLKREEIFHLKRVRIYGK